MHDVVALSGNTGYSSEPHLHVGVFRNVDGTKRTSIPIQFITKSGKINSLSAGQAY
jgi:murein DD-endopeptidase MepM/ murein hydrolase activator NlpD